MKNVKPKLGFIVAAALVGISSTSLAQMPIIPDAEFIPLENLSAADRSVYAQQISALEESALIDWESVVPGVNENGELVLKDRKSLELQMVSEPSCWTTSK